jgi:hypothetical protein
LCHFFHSQKAYSLQHTFAIMLSEIIKKKIENKSGLRVRYVRDCNALAEKISTECRCSISGSTIRRLYGLGGGIGEPRVYTLDLIAAYLGYVDWDELLNSFNPAVKSDAYINELKPMKLKIGEKFEIDFEPTTTLHIEYIGKSKFKVLSAENSQLKPDEVFSSNTIILHHPLFALREKSNNTRECRVIEGKVSGVTSIRKV